MGTRKVETPETPEEHTHTHDDAPQRQVDAGKMIARLQQQRAALQEQLDFAELTIADQNEQIRALLAERDK